MKILFDGSTGKIYYVVPDADYFFFTHTTNIPLLIFEIDEIDPTNKEVCIDLRNTVGKIDAEGDPKYIISGGALMAKESWVEAVIDFG